MKWGMWGNRGVSEQRHLVEKGSIRLDNWCLFYIDYWYGFSLKLSIQSSGSFEKFHI